MRADRFSHLSPGLVCFLAYKLLGALWDSAFVAFGLLWALPRLSAAGGSEFAPDLLGDLLVPAAGIVGVCCGAVVLIRGSVITRAYWLVYSALYSVALAWEVLFGLESRGALVFLIGALGWMAYWAYGRAPRQLAFAKHWKPAPPAAEQASG